MARSWTVSPFGSGTLGMPMPLALVVVISACAAIVACTNRLPASALAPRLQYQGFSVARPPNDSWYVNRNEQNHTALLFRREVAGEAHSFFFAVRVSALEREPSSDDDFTELVHRYMVAVNDPQRHQVLSYDAMPTSLQGQFCLRYTLQTIDRKSPVLPDRHLRMSFGGIACRHPLWPNAVLDAHYSERGPLNELDPSLHHEGDQLLRGVVIEVAPGVPADREGAPAAGPQRVSIEVW